MSGVERLTAAQKECLRLVFRQMSSKDIAKTLGTSPHTVDNHIKSAIQKLNVANRREAALYLAEDEGLAQRRELANQSPELGRTRSLLASSSRPTEGSLAGGSMRIVQTGRLETDTAPQSVASKSSFRLPFPQQWGDENNLSSTQRILWVLILGILICIGLGAVVATIEALARII